MSENVMAMTESRTDAIASEINAIKKTTEKTVRGVMLRAVVDIGRLLTEAKGMVPHGEWGAWLEKNVDYSQTTAGDMMRLYAEYGDTQVPLDGGPTDDELFGAIAPSKALALLALPREERREYVQTHDVDDVSVRQLREELAAVKADRDAVKAAAKALEATSDAEIAAAEQARKKAEEDAERLRAEKDKAAKEAELAAAEKAKKELEKIKKKLADAEKKAAERAKQITALQEQIEAAGEEEEAEEEAEAEEPAAPQESEEILALRAEKERLEKQLKAAAPEMAKFGLLLTQWQETCGKMLEMIESADNDDARKMWTALSKVSDALCASIAARVPG